VSEWQIKLFIETFKQLCKGGNVSLVPRDKNKEFLEKIGWLPEDIINYLYENLSTDNFYSGPENDRDDSHKPGIVCVFLVSLEGYSVYIKIKEFKEEFKATVISFHEEGRW